MAIWTGIKKRMIAANYRRRVAITGKNPGLWNVLFLALKGSPPPEGGYFLKAL